MEATGTRWETARVEAFSDGVFAIAITLLVLEIGIDPANFDHLWRALADEWPSYLAYVRASSPWAAYGSPTTACIRTCATSTRC